MKIAIFSDSHGNFKTILRVIEAESPEMVLHLGDHASDMQRFKLPRCVKSLHAVLGNCDFGSYPLHLQIRLQGKLFYLMHGHTKGVKLGLSRAILAAKENGADVLVYGHTHQPKIDFLQGLLVFNPGSCAKSSALARGTYGIITVENGILKPDIRPVKSCCY